ncbi:hypothetical protein SAMN05421736_102315 [Evansella caseinilytica]|uniref:Stressosome-associated protein Prli42 n=1 Tax=Evansella caseinilytica TaxID=1503961 RepID=A0A1H3L1A6_9BACI|nr:stressosome-associated protein Prli42 [Evansella caseinilytica]SDY57684.1 hypothetical protein SAMN05421736_102315 [Evansella caseinilytica]
MPRKFRKMIIYIMIAIMFLGTVLTGLAFL